MNSVSKKGQQLAALLQQEGISDPRVLNVMARIPRHLFLTDALAHNAYQNNALPIGQGQTISQPYIVARMTELLLQSPKAPQRILEIGTGSGYQSAVLASLMEQVFSVERIKSLQFQAKRRLQHLDLHNVAMKHGDGWQGWASKGPFDAIIVTAAAKSVPTALLSQLNDGARLIIPVGEDNQHLHCVDRNGDALSQKRIEAVRFVPLIQGDVS